MRFEYIVLLIIAFNVVTAVMQRRAKNKAKNPKQVGGPRGDRNEGARDRDARDVNAARPRESDAAGRDAPQQPGLGRDILDQIARDLGLRLPRPEMPRNDIPEDVPYEAVPQPAIVRSAEPRAMPVSTAAPAPLSALARGKASSIPALSRAVAPRNLPRVDLRNAEKLREAFILKEILDGPVSRRGRRIP